MPLRGPTEPVDALEEAVRHHPSAEDIKSISDLLTSIGRKVQEKPKNLHKFRKVLEKFNDKLGEKNVRNDDQNDTDAVATT